MARAPELNFIGRLTVRTRLAGKRHSTDDDSHAWILLPLETAL